MEIKLRRKGEVVVVAGLPANSIPVSLSPPDGLEGIDLTGYSVIFATFGRGGHEKAKDLHKNAPRTILVYKYEWRNGWGEGVLLPASFNPSRVHYYKSAVQEKDEAEAAKKKALKALLDQVTETIPGVRANVSYNNDGVDIIPEQEAFADWDIRVTTLAEAVAGVEKMRPLWMEWNARALEAYSRHSGSQQNPGTGNLQISPTPIGRMPRIGVCVVHNSPKKWVWFEKKGDGSWMETETREYPPPAY